MDQQRNEIAKTLKRRGRAARRRLDYNGGRVVQHAQGWTRARLDNLQIVRRNVIWWIMAVGLLSIASVVQSFTVQQATLSLAPATGGSYVEGVADKLTTLNPLFATTDTEVAASNLLYRGLFSYDNSNHLAGDLVSTWSTADGKVWNINLRHNATWSDGRAITADDVIFTLNLIKNSAVNSPLRNTLASDDVVKTGDFGLKFTLPLAYMSFPYSLTFGILPEHTLTKLSPASLDNYLSTSFANIVTSGAMTYGDKMTLAGGQTAWRLVPSKRSADRLRIASLTIRTYYDGQDLVQGLNDGEINAAAGVSAADAEHLAHGQRLTQVTLNNGVFALLNNDSTILSDANLRAALRIGTNNRELRSTATLRSSKLSSVQPLETPIAPGIYSSVDNMKQPAFDLSSAKNKLDELGWKLNSLTGIREKSGQRLIANIVTIAGTDYEPVAEKLAAQWRQLGVDARLTKADPTTANDQYLASRNYDVLVYDLHLGADPDETAYWSSTQMNEHGLNFANYNSRRADLALSAGLRQPDSTAREARYDAFVKRWLDDAPGIALYQPRYYYVTTGAVRGLNSDPLISPSERYRDISDWSVLTTTVNATP
ncbi:MAG: ABC transporter substrate-binding protein [Candidatus Nanoperiomorbaceae bacterium]